MPPVPVVPPLCGIYKAKLCVTRNDGSFEVQTRCKEIGFLKFAGQNR